MLSPMIAETMTVLAGILIVAAQVVIMLDQWRPDQ